MSQSIYERYAALLEEYNKTKAELTAANTELKQALAEALEEVDDLSDYERTERTDATRTKFNIPVEEEDT